MFSTSVSDSVFRPIQGGTCHPESSLQIVSKGLFGLPLHFSRTGFFSGRRYCTLPPEKPPLGEMPHTNASLLIKISGIWNAASRGVNMHISATQRFSGWFSSALTPGIIKHPTNSAISTVSASILANYYKEITRTFTRSAHGPHNPTNGPKGAHSWKLGAGALGLILTAAYYKFGDNIIQFIFGADNTQVNQGSNGTFIQEKGNKFKLSNEKSVKPRQGE